MGGRNSGNRTGQLGQELVEREGFEWGSEALFGHTEYEEPHRHSHREATSVLNTEVWGIHVQMAGKLPTGTVATRVQCR